MRLSPQLLFSCLLTASACGRPEPQAGAARDSAAAPSGRRTHVVTATSYGPVRFGQTIAAVSSALGEPLKPAYRDNETCDYVHPTGLPAGTALMVIQDTVMRVDVDSGGIPTAEGARVGDSETSVVELYKGRVAVQPHKYTGPEGHYLVVSQPGDTMHALIFETDGKRVVNYRAGRRPAVELIEGCS